MEFARKMKIFGNVDYCDVDYVLCVSEQMKR